MLPPPGLAPTLPATPTSAAAFAIATIATSLLSLGVDIPSQTSSPSPTPSSHPDPENGECRLLGPFAIFVQGALGLLAITALVYKRWRERPQRPVKIWFFDASKQVVGSVLVHIANLGMSLLSSGQFSIRVGPEIVARGLSAAGLGGLEVVRRMVDGEGKYRPNPCSFYLLNLAIDTTIGIPILILLLRILTALLQLTPIGSPPESIRSGNYGSPPSAWWWFKQSIIYFIGLMGMKICVLIIFLAAPWISRVGDWALKWTEGDEVLQVVFVMLVFPVIMNATQYYIIDSFIKNQKAEEELDDESVEGDAYTDPEVADDEGTDESEDAELLAKSDVKVETVRHKKLEKGSGSGVHTPLKTGQRDYDPLFDGESSPTVVGSASTRGPREDNSEDERKLASR